MVVAGVRLAYVHLVELPLVGPSDNPFVLKGIRQGEGFQNPRGRLLDAVPVSLQAVLDIQDTVGDVLLDLFLDLEVVFFPFGLG